MCVVVRSVGFTSATCNHDRLRRVPSARGRSVRQDLTRIGRFLHIRRPCRSILKGSFPRVREPCQRELDLLWYVRHVYPLIYVAWIPSVCDFKLPILRVGGRYRSGLTYYTLTCCNAYVRMYSACLVNSYMLSSCHLIGVGRYFDANLNHAWCTNVVRTGSPYANDHRSDYD